MILSGAHLLLSDAADSQNHWKTAERGQSYTKERGANLVVSFIFIAISFFEIITLWNWVGSSHRDGVKNPKGSKYLWSSLKDDRAQNAICTLSPAGLSGSSLHSHGNSLEGCQWTKQQQHRTPTLEKTRVDRHPSSSSPQELSFLRLRLRLQTLLPSPQDRFLCNTQLKVVHCLRPGLHPPSPCGIKRPFCYVTVPEGYSCCIQVHITRLVKHYQSRC